MALVNCLELDAEDIRQILGLVLEEFPVCEVTVKLPAWTTALNATHRIRTSLTGSLCTCAGNVTRMGDVRAAYEALAENEYVGSVAVDRLDMGTGKAEITLGLRDGLYYEVISEMTGLTIDGECALIGQLRELAQTKKQYDRVAEALRQVNEGGYGIVMPEVEDLRLEEPKIVKQAGGYGVKLRAAAQSIHMIRANIETEISPMVGTEQQSEDMVKYLLKEFEEDPRSIWGRICSENRFTSWSTRACTPNWNICPRNRAKSFPRRWSASSTRAATV